MNLYKVYNGFTGYSAVHVIALAADEDKAKEIASEQFKENAEEEDYERKMKLYSEKGWNTELLKKYKYPESYWTNLEADLLCENIEDNEWFVTGVED